MSRRSTAKPVTSKDFWRRFLGTAVMFTFGYVGKHRYIVDGFGDWEEEFRAPVGVMPSTRRSQPGRGHAEHVGPGHGEVLDHCTDTSKDKPFMIF